MAAVSSVQMDELNQMKYFNSRSF